MGVALAVVEPEEIPVVKRAKVRLATGFCLESTCRCPLRTTGKQVTAKFCSNRCRDTFSNRQKVQGRQLINIAKRWRRFKRPGDFTRMTRVLDALIRADIANGVDVYPEPPLEADQVVTNIRVRRRS